MDCPACACTSATGAAAHAIQAALLEDDFDRALAMGLMEPDHACADCSAACRATLESAGRQREAALAARERHRARNERLARRQRERAEKRRPRPAPAGATPALPPAAAAALARAKARAAGRGDP